ncbi:FG-GAP repeat protein [Streptomyces sp. CO7]
MNRTTRTALAVTAAAALAVGGAVVLISRPEPVAGSHAARDAAGHRAGPGTRLADAGETGRHPDRPDVDHDADGKADLVTSAANARVGHRESAGQIVALHGGANGLARAVGITRDTPGVPSASSGDNAFGGGLALGDIDADGRLDLAIGIPGDNIGGVWDTGAVVLLHGTADGIGTAGGRYLHQETAGVPGSHRNGDRLGEDLLLDDVTGDGRADLIAAVPGEDGVGGILYLPADGTGAITTAGAHVLSPASAGVPARPTDRHDSYVWAPGFAEHFAD